LRKIALMKLDHTDRRILALLQQDASRSVAEIGADVGLSQTPCWRRIQKLRAAGVIERTVAVLDPHAIGLGLIVFIEVEALDHTPERQDNFTRQAAAMPEVLEIHRMAGETDYLLRVAVRDMAHFDAFYKRLIAAGPLKSVTSKFAMERVKSSTAYPLDLEPSARG
jgi:Lrp/AsnC family transcriptional regulator